MNGEDLELQMPSDLRGDGHEDTKPFLESMSPGQPTDVEEPSRKGILHFTVNVPPGSVRQRTVQARPPPRWRTPEFYLYYLVFAVAVPIMVWKPIRLSEGAQKSFLTYSRMSLIHPVLRVASQLCHIQQKARKRMDIRAQDCE